MADSKQTLQHLLRAKGKYTFYIPPVLEGELE